MLLSIIIILLLVVIQCVLLVSVSFAALTARVAAMSGVCPEPRQSAGGRQYIYIYIYIYICVQMPSSTRGQS